MSTASQPQIPTGPVQIGQVVAGKYRIESILGASGMGIVYAAIHLEMDARVAVKFLLVKNNDSPEDALERFKREAKFMAKIHSEHVVRVIDVGAVGDVPFIVMELLNGEDLARVLLRRGPLPIETAVDYVLQAAEGLAAAHGAGVVHRDLKPSNLFLCHVDNREVVKLIDFGVAKYRGADTGPQNDALTHTHVMIGSPRYMAPEQVRASKDVDARADVWSLAIIMQELVTGKPVFKGPTVSDSLVLILTTDAPRADAVRPDVPAPLADAIARALAKDPNYRTPTVAAFAAELLPFASMTRRSVFEPLFAHATPPRVPRTFSADSTSDVNATITDPTRTAWGTGVTANAPKPNHVAMIAIAAALGAVIAGGALAYFAMHRPRTVAAPAPPTREAALSSTADNAPPPPPAEPKPPATEASHAPEPPPKQPTPAPKPSVAVATRPTPAAPAPAKPVKSATTATAAPPPAADPKPNLFDDPK